MIFLMSGSTRQKSTKQESTRQESTRRSPPAPQRGAGLVEVMVSLLILGVGLLGVLSLQAKGLNSNQRAVFVTEAQILAQDMADRIMAFGNDPTGDNTGRYKGTDTRSPPDTVSCRSGCTPAEARQYDQAQWAKQVNSSTLPNGRGEVRWANSVYTIRVIWDQERSGNSNAVSNCNPDNCYQLELRLP